MAAPAAPDDLSVATFNVENLDPTDPQSKFDDLAQIIVHNLRAPDLVALEEVQDNNGATDNGVVDAEVVGASVASATPDRVVTLLFVNQTSSTNLKSGKTTSLNRVRMTMERDDDGRWLVDEIEAL